MDNTEVKDFPIEPSEQSDQLTSIGLMNTTSTKRLIYYEAEDKRRRIERLNTLEKLNQDLNEMLLIKQEKLNTVSVLKRGKHEILIDQIFISIAIFIASICFSKNVNTIGWTISIFTIAVIVCRAFKIKLYWGKFNICNVDKFGNFKGVPQMFNKKTIRLKETPLDFVNNQWQPQPQLRHQHPRHRSVERRRRRGDDPRLRFRPEWPDLARASSAA